MTKKNKKTYAWKDPGLLSHIYVGLLAAGSASALGCALLELSGGHFTGDETAFTPAQFANWLLVLAMTAAMFGGVVVAIFWALRVNKNAHTFKPRMEHSPASMIYWYVVPLMFLFKPFGALKEVWTVSGGQKDGLMRVWWGLFLASNFTGRFSTVVDSVEMNVVFFLFEAASAAIFIPIVLQLLKLQRQTHETVVFSEPAAEQQPLVFA